MWREAFGLDEASLSHSQESVRLRHFVNSDSRCGPLLVPALLTPVAIAEEDVLQLAALLPTMAPIVGPSTTVVAIEGETAWKLAPHSSAPHSTLIITKTCRAAKIAMNIIY